MKWIIAFIVFSILVLFHEFGHFLVARLNGVTVEEFSLGFGPRLLSAVSGGTRYSLKALPFGGSCRMKGLMDDTGEGVIDKSEGSFFSASVGRRAAIIFAGPFFNFLLAFIGAVIVISVVGYDPAKVLYVAEDSPAYEAGLRAGDEITSFMGSPIDIGRDLSTWYVMHDLKAGEEIRVTWKRDGEKQSAVFLPNVETRYMMGITYTLDSDTARVDQVSVGSPLDAAGVRAGDVITSVNGTEITDGKSLNAYFEEHPLTAEEVSLVLLRSGHTYETKVTPVRTDYVKSGFSYNLYREKIGAAGVLKYGLIEVKYWIRTVISSLAAMFTGRFSVNDLSGPVGVVDIVGSTYEEAKEEGALMTWMNMINLIILLSANLGVMNLLPIPALDGGRLVFLIAEAVRGKPVDRKVEMAFQTVAAVLLMILMVYVMYHDILMMLTH